MIIEIGQGLLAIMVIASFLTFLVAPEILILGLVVFLFSMFAIGLTGKELTVQTKNGVIIQMNTKTQSDGNVTGVLK